ncbi:expressed unknown protein [Seminavis robusta]|uniref:Exostosin GT47 domain-containing protein n=1 Tax=Seminavis robusta TaxID=568900 RepID=A0A9N8ESP2_9STRA|nr:expressed unknown protein [Seminavis robusta]|eukprot:Sro1843_g301190.1 n/a (379) ;mRNA; r:12577-13713
MASTRRWIVPSVLLVISAILVSNLRSSGKSTNHVFQTELELPLANQEESRKLTVEGDDECKNKLSLHQMCLDMIAFSSPPGSPSYNKMQNVLGKAKSYKVHLAGKGIYESNEANIRAMLEGYGLPASTPDDPPETVLHVQSDFTFCADCHTIPRIFVQSEQLATIGHKIMKKNLKPCHDQELCVIWEYSDFQYHWMKERKMQDSVVLLPIMHQSRLGEADNMHSLTNRSIDVVFFGDMSRKRRKPLIKSFNDELSNVRAEQTKSTKRMKKSYEDSKVCLITHGYHTGAAGETHRLSEFGRFGCIPILETWSDELFLEPYRKCADVVFADYDNLLNATKAVLNGINSSDDKNLSKRVNWWRTGVKWELVLTTAMTTAPS